MASWAIGSVVGVLIAGKFKPKFPIRTALITQFPLFFWFYSLAHTNHIWLIIIFAFFVGVAYDLFYVLWVTTFQQHVPKESLSKVMAYDVLGSLAMAPLGLAIAGPLAEEFGATSVINVIGFIFLIILVIPLLFKDVRMIESRHEVASEKN